MSVYAAKLVGFFLAWHAKHHGYSCHHGLLRFKFVEIGGLLSVETLIALILI